MTVLIKQANGSSRRPQFPLFEKSKKAGAQPTSFRITCSTVTVLLLENGFRFSSCFLCIQFCNLNAALAEQWTEKAPLTLPGIHQTDASSMVAAPTPAGTAWRAAKQTESDTIAGQPDH
ncbi:MAG: hypothetical protein FWD79_00640 [Desulfobulbus sp.]|nr:hypothetical protein [Desulfobulbus sp.]